MTQTDAADLERLIDDLREAMQPDPDPAVVRHALRPLRDADDDVVIDLTEHDPIPLRQPA